MEWIIVVLVFAVVVGPVLWLQPSIKEKMAALRQQAAQMGIKVRLERYEDYPIAVYYLPLELPDDPDTFVLLQQSYAHEAHFFEQWDITAGSMTLSDGQQLSFKQYLQCLSPEIVGVELKVNAIGVWWREKNVTVDEIKVSLEQLKRLLIV